MRAVTIINKHHIAAVGLLIGLGTVFWLGCNSKSSKEDAIQMVLKLENLKSLDFYGKVVDQHGNPVVDAKVRGGVGLNVDFIHSGGKDYFTETDLKGRFSFVGIRGTGIGIWVSKEGYDCDQSQNEQRPPNYFQHDPNNPVVFTMWKLKGPEPMVHSKIQTAIPCDGTTVSFDLLTGKKVSSGGDLTVKLLRNPVNIVRGKPFDWSITFEIENGGLAEIADLYPYEAPSDGYRSSIATNIPAAIDMKDFADALTRSYYFKCRNGQVYGRMKIQIQADFQPPPTFFSVEIYVNPSGSRNLEYDRHVPGTTF